MYFSLHGVNIFAQIFVGKSKDLNMNLVSSGVAIPSSFFFLENFDNMLHLQIFVFICRA